jgi:3'-phosphoadenosine 5'-phosphosulfate sulfotransferase (PAPS reductase)/FAD synthetase
MPEDLRERFEAWSGLSGFWRRVKAAHDCLDDWLSRCEHPYVAFSTGKDSICVLDLVWGHDPTIPAVYFDADCSYPESRAMLDRLRLAGRPLILWPTSEPFLVTLRRLGLDNPQLERETMKTTVWQPIKALLAVHHFDGVALGLRGDECPGREKLARFRGQVFLNHRDGVWQCLPIAGWSYDDVWAYIVMRKIEYCGVYDRLWDAPEEDQRLSYWAGETKRRWGRYAWLKRNYPGLWNELAALIPEARSYT